MTATRLILFRQEIAPQQWLDTKNRKQIGSHLVGLNLLGPAIAGDRQNGVTNRPDFIESMTPSLPVRKIARSHRIIGNAESRPSFPDLYHLRFIPKLQRTKQNGIRQTKDRNRADNPKSQRKNDGY